MANNKSKPIPVDPESQEIGGLKAKAKAPKFENKDFPKDLTLKGTSPRGIASYPVIPPSEPDTKFKEAGEYKVSLSIPQPQAQPLIDECRDVLKRAIEAFKAKTGQTPEMCENLPFSLEVDDDGNETGNVLFSFKSTASWKSKSGEIMQRRIPVVDAKKNPMRRRIGGGSTLRVGYSIAPFWTAALGLGLTSRMELVQCIDLQEFQGRDPNSAFQEEDGYTEEDETTSGSAAVGDTGDGSEM